MKYIVFAIALIA